MAQAALARSSRGQSRAPSATFATATRTVALGRVECLDQLALPVGDRAVGLGQQLGAALGELDDVAPLVAFVAVALDQVPVGEPPVIVARLL